jgi:hypothetical protein
MFNIIRINIRYKTLWFQTPIPTLTQKEHHSIINKQCYKKPPTDSWQKCFVKELIVLAKLFADGNSVSTSDISAKIKIVGSITKSKA